MQKVQKKLKKYQKYAEKKSQKSTSKVKKHKNVQKETYWIGTRILKSTNKQKKATKNSLKKLSQKSTLKIKKILKKYKNLFKFKIHVLNMLQRINQCKEINQFFIFVWISATVKSLSWDFKYIYKRICVIDYPMS